MDNRIKESKVTFTTDDGEEKILFYDLNALEELENKYGDLGTAYENIAKSQTMKDIKYMLYLGLKHNEPDITEYEAGRLAGSVGLNQLTNYILSALWGSLPEIDSTEGKN